MWSLTSRCDNCIQNSYWYTVKHNFSWFMNPVYFNSSDVCGDYDQPYLLNYRNVHKIVYINMTCSVRTSITRH
jgi:hypothetical protein